MNTLTAPSPFLQAVADAGDEAVRADRHRLASLVAELASGRRPSITAEQTGELLRRLNMPAEVLEELVAVRQRLDHLRAAAAVEPEAREHLREATAAHTRELEEIQKQEQALRARRTAAEDRLRQARGEVEQAQTAARQASDALGELLRLLAPSLEHDMRTANAGVKTSASRIGELKRKIEQAEGELKETASAEFSKPELRATRLQVLQDLRDRLRKELAETEAAHERAKVEHEALAAEAALLCGEEVGR